MPLNAPAPPEPARKRVVAAVRSTAKTHIEPILLGIGFVLGALVAMLAR